MDEVVKKLREQEAKLEAIFRSVEKTRRYFLLTLILSVVFFVLPLIGLLFIIPQFLSTLGGGADLLK